MGEHTDQSSGKTCDAQQVKNPIEPANQSFTILGRYPNSTRYTGFEIVFNIYCLIHQAKDYLLMPL